MNEYCHLCLSVCVHSGMSFAVLFWAVQFITYFKLLCLRVLLLFSLLSCRVALDGAVDFFTTVFSV